MIAENYACAYKEVIEVLKYTKREDVNKIPKYRILLWKTNMNKDYDFKIDTTKSLKEQNLSDEAKAIIANIFKKYWATDYQRERIEAKEKYDIEQLEKEKQTQSIKEKSLVVVNEETWYKKIFSIIKSFFNK